MLKNLREWTSRVSGSLWFVPAIMLVCSVFLAVAMVWVDYAVSREALIKYPRLFGASAESSRALLAAIAGSMITVAGVTFSITVVAVSQASAQYSSRILRNFMSDRSNQVVLGVFVGVFTYCLVVARTIRGSDDLMFVPAVSTIFAFVLAIVALGFLIFFIHHIAESLQAANLLDRIRLDTIRTLERRFPEPLNEGTDTSSPATEFSEAAAGQVIVSDRTGYIQHVDCDALMKLASERGFVIKLKHRVGDFVVENAPIVSVDQTDKPDATLSKRVNRAFMVMPYRTIEQDVAFGFRQIVDVALKALSPAVNDTTTAVACVDHLSALLSRLAGRRIDGGVYGDDGQLHVLARGPTFAQLVDLAFNEIRRSAAGNVAMLEHILSALATIGAFTVDLARRSQLRRHVMYVEEIAVRTTSAEHDKKALVSRCREVMAALGGGNGGGPQHLVTAPTKEQT